MGASKMRSGMGRLIDQRRNRPGGQCATLRARGACAIRTAAGRAINRETRLVEPIMDTLREMPNKGHEAPVALGRSPDLRVYGQMRLPGFPVAFCIGLAAHSCGGSHGIGPMRVILTVFPVRPLAVWH